jgi:hypothetical protein
LEAQFFTLWTNGAYNEALNLLTLLERNVLPLENTLALLFEFIIVCLFCLNRHSFSHNFKKMVFLAEKEPNEC